MDLHSEAATLELIPAEELFKVRPEVVPYVYVVMPLVPLQLQLLDVPAVDNGWNLRVREVNVVASDSSEQLSLLTVVLPVAELPVLPIDEDSDDALPSRLSEVRNIVVDVEGNSARADLPRNTNHLAGSE